ncbi:MAG: rhodanese-like domain-containing protein [Thermoguttaceae bacterium]
MTISNISPSDLAKLNNNGHHIRLIDVRTPAEYRHVHAEPASNIPLDKLDPTAMVCDEDDADGQPVYIICHSGTRSRQACEKLFKAGYTNVVNVEGGTKAWESSGLPVVRGKKAISLERQVRITAGFLVCLGALLSWLIHPAFIILSAFIGAGLIFAGVTDTCGMGLLLARMPWNQDKQSKCCC